MRLAGPLTRAELAEAMALSVPAVTGITRRLEETGLLKSGQRSLGPGRTALEYGLDPDGAFAIGLRLRRDRGEAALVDLAGTVRDVRRFQIADLLADTLPVIDSLVSGIDRARLAGFGLATDDGISADLLALRQELDPLPVITESETVALALAEAPSSGAPDSLVVVTIGRRVRAGLVLGGAAFGGVNGRAGRIGRMRTGADRVTLDSVASTTSLAERIGAALPGWRSPTEPADLLATDGVAEVVACWTPVAATHLLDAVVALAGFTAPGRVLIGGDLPDAVIDELVSLMEAERRGAKNRPVPPPWLPRIQRAEHPRIGAARGAGLSVLYETVLLHPNQAYAAT
ncbi:ROK family transcriptional regulator [Pelagovum pacificum]|uniref:ROK family transcriptional regulator n=1 Tax=Pelagovum pacificum TaxID=2588711 RepID=UPI0018CD68B7|nr:ROK family transcriptional regulator [Pelagovum pacificum]QQA43908.1 ROK family transcriptional regulator [Pelagovum pacificum]